MPAADYRYLTQLSLAFPVGNEFNSAQSPVPTQICLCGFLSQRPNHTTQCFRGFPLLGVPEIVMHLHPEPTLRGRVGRETDTQRHLGTDCGAGVDYLGEGLARDTQALGGLGDAVAQRHKIRDCAIPAPGGEERDIGVRILGSGLAL